MIFIFYEESSSQTLIPPDYLTKGIANLKEENYEEAVEDFKKVREENPDSSTAAYLLGLAYKKVQDYKEAKVHLKDALTLAPPVKEAVPELSDVLYQLGEMEEALKEIEFAEGLGMESARTSFLKGQVLSELGKKSDIVLDDGNI
ncbi:MAG: tetratricopeptide repeat protein, partial [Nitrospinae bacterium]|nr:tetratricopeptide repeat protein [Nitrospinota bacterium]